MEENTIIDIGYFTPPAFVKRPLDIDGLDEMCGKHFMYASKGRWCLFHILKSLNIKGPVLLPVYCCSTVLEPLDALGISYKFYDISPETLNADLDSIRSLTNLYNPDCIIAVSMYGNPCQLTKLEQFCKEKEIALVDDAAQSFGAKENGRLVGTFGDAGFFAFSPGKPFSGHMGGLFWTTKPYEIEYKRHRLLHRVVYKNFIVNRVGWLKNRNRLIPRLLKKTTDILSRNTDIKYDSFEPFETQVIGGILHDSWHLHTPRRTQLALRSKDEIHQTSLFEVLLPTIDDKTTGIAHKYVCICQTPTIAENLLQYLKKHRVAAQKGYRMLSLDLSQLPGAKIIDGRIVELPLDPDEKKHQYIISVINKYIKDNDSNSK